LAEAEATQMRIEAEAAETAEAILAEAERDAEAQRAEAHDEIRRAWHKADRERQLLEAEAQRLQTLRRILAEQLGQVHTHLGLALRATDDGGGDKGGSDVEASRADSPDAAATAGRGAEEARGRANETDQGTPPQEATATR
jgi:hypothetical protein